MALKTPHGAALLLYVGRHPRYGDAVLVSKERSAFSQDQIVDSVFDGGYVTFYPATAAVRKGLVAVVARLAPRELPKIFRRPGAIMGTKVGAWIIQDGPNETMQRTLSAEDLELPIAEIWNHEYLVEMIVEGWHPRLEGKNDE